MKIKLTAIASLLLLACVLSSCSAPVCAKLMTGGESGTYYSLGNALSELLGSNEDAKGDPDKTKFTATFEVVASSGYRENLISLSDGSTQMAIVRGDLAYYALNGLHMFKDQKLEGFSLVCELYNEAVHIMAKLNTGTVSNLSGKRVAVGKKGSDAAILSDIIMTESGVTDYDPVYISAEEAIEPFKAGELDAIIFPSGITSNYVTDLSSRHTFEMLDIDSEVIDAICSKYPFLRPVTVPKRTYSVLKAALHTVSLRACLLARDDMDAELIYKIVDRFAKDSKLLEHKKYTELSVDGMWTYTCLPIHEGASKYFEEYKKEKAEKESNKTTKKPETTASPESTDSPDNSVGQ